MLRIFPLMLLLVAAGACGQTRPIDDPSNRKEEQRENLPDSLMGVWVTSGEGYRQFGELTIGREVLSWAACSEVRYRVLKTKDKMYYVELLRSPPCKFGFHASFLALEPSDERLEVSICRERDEFDRPPAQRFCSWGILYRKDH